MHVCSVCLNANVLSHWVIEWREQRGKEDKLKEANSNHQLPQALIHGPPQLNYTQLHIHIHTQYST